MSPALHRVKPQNGETARSLVARLAAANGIERAQDFCTDMRLDLPRLDAGDSDELTKLAVLAGADASSLKAAALLTTSEGTFLGQLKVSRRHSARSALRVCPHCLSDDLARSQERKLAARPWLRCGWQVALQRTCAIHRCLLVGLGSDSTRHLQGDIPALVSKHNDVLINAAENAEVLPPSPLEDYVAARMAGEEAELALEAVVPFYLVPRLSEVVGASVRFGRKFVWNKLSEGQRVAAGATGFDVLSSGYEAFHEFLEPLYKDWTRTTATGAKGLGGSFFTWLQDGRKNPDLDDLREMIRNHAAECLPLGPGDEFLGVVKSPRKLHSVCSAHSEHGIHPKRLKKLLVQEGFITPEAAKLSDMRIVFDARRADHLLNAMANECIGNDARDYLGMTRVQWQEIRSADFVKPLFGASDGTYASYSKKVLDCFLASVRYEKGSGGKLVGLSRCVKLATCRYVDIVHLLQANQLERVSYDPNKVGFSGVLVDATDVIKKLPQPELPGLTAREVSQRLGVALDTVHALTANGDLSSVCYKTYGGSREQRLVQKEEVEAFIARYITLKELAAVMGVDHWPRRARILMDEMGIEPPFTLANYRTVIYRRDEALAALNNYDR